MPAAERTPSDNVTATVAVTRMWKPRFNKSAPHVDTSNGPFAQAFYVPPQANWHRQVRPHPLPTCSGLGRSDAAELRHESVHVGVPSQNRWSADYRTAADAVSSFIRKRE
jgi:hypothetical protein